MPLDPRLVIESAARNLAYTLSALPNPPSLRVAEVEGRVACLIFVCDVSEGMPSIGVRRRSGGGRIGCKADILEVIRAMGSPITRKEVIKALRQAGKSHGTGAVAKALADLTSDRELVNRKDKKGYRLPEWIRRRETASLFE